MFLAIDIGNTATGFGLFDGRRYSQGFKVSTSDSVEKIARSFAENFEETLNANSPVNRSGICSVVPKLTPKIIEIVEKKLAVTPQILTSGLRLNFKLSYSDPSQLGTDRLANIIAARELYGYPAIVIDMGTATKYEAIDANGDYAGGAIAPGLGISAESLFARGAQLFAVDPGKPGKMIGANTTDCLKSGIFYGYLGQLRFMINGLKSEMGQPDSKVIATGGYADLFLSETGLFDTVDPELTLRGVQVALDQ